jgi:hypothetical protein
MAANRLKTEVEEDRNVITPLYLKGYTLREIANRCTDITGRSISFVTVRSDVKAILKAFQTNRDDMIQYNLTIELEKINVLELEYWSVWEKSKADRKKKSIKKKTRSGSKSLKENKYPIEETTEYNDTEMVNMGDPRYLAGIQWCIEQRCKLLGIGAPTKVEMSGSIILEQITGMKVI